MNPRKAYERTRKGEACHDSRIDSPESPEEGRLQIKGKQNPRKEKLGEARNPTKQTITGKKGFGETTSRAILD